MIAMAAAAQLAAPLAAQLAAPSPAGAQGARGARHGSVHEDAFVPPSLGVTKHLIVYLPPSYGSHATRRYPVLYYLHGLYGSETDWLSKGAIDIVADSLFAAGAPEAIIVLPDGDDGWYTTWVHPVPLATCADTLHGEAPSRYCVEHPRYDDYVARDVVAYVDANYRTRADRAHRGIGGLSMGGYGAMELALRYPAVFAAAASHSGVVSPLYAGGHPFVAPARYAPSVDSLRAMKTAFLDRYLMFWGDDMTVWRAHDPARLVEELQQRGGPMPAVYADCGTEDALTVDQNRAFDWELTRLGVPHAYHEYPGAHTWRYWSTHVGQSLAWMLGVVAR